jgi:hypothetical protein
MDTSNGARLPPKPVAFQQPASSVIIEPTPEARPVARDRVTSTIAGMPTGPRLSNAEPTFPQASPARRSVPPSPWVPPATPWEPPPAVDADDAPFPRRSKKPLWLGFGVCLAGAIGFGAWVMSSGHPTAPAPPARAASEVRPPADQPPHAETAALPQPPRPDISAATSPPRVEISAATPPSRPEVASAAPPPRTETGRAAAPTPASAPAVAPGTTRGAPLSPPAVPAAFPPLPRAIATPAPPPPAHAAAPKPAPRPRPASTTIVHEVPF